MPKIRNLEKEFVHIKQPVREGMLTFHQRKSVLLEVHRQVHKDSNGKEWITLKGREVCPSAW